MKLSFASSIIAAVSLGGNKAFVKAVITPNGVPVSLSFPPNLDAKYYAGKYFSFNITEWIEYFGSFTNSTRLPAKQCRSFEEVWSGTIAVWDESLPPPYVYHGRRDPLEIIQAGDWNDGDYIVRPEDDCELTSPPTSSPTEAPTSHPTASPTWHPLSNPTDSPTAKPTSAPTDVPTYVPTFNPTASPTWNPTVTPGWVIDYRSMSADFSSNSNTELTMAYDISSTREYEHTLLEKDCSTPIGGNVITNSTASTSPYRNGTSLLLIKHDINKAAVASSSIWNSTSNSIEVCEVVSLVIPATDTEEKMVISQVKRVSAVLFDMEADFTIVNELEDAEAGTAAQSTGLDDYVVACKCDDAVPFACNTNPLKPSEELKVCVKSISADVPISAITGMNINQGSDMTLSVIADSEIKYASFSSMTEVASEFGYKVTVLLPINLFNFAGPNITVEGSLEMQLGSGRRLRNSRALAEAEAVPFQLEIALSEEEDAAEIMDVAEGASDTAPGYLVPVLAAVGSVSLLAMAGMAFAYRKRHGNAIA